MLTDAQKTNVRRWAGYEIGGDAASALFSAPVFTATGHQGMMTGMTLDFRLDHLTPSEEQVLLDLYLARLTTLETDVLLALDNVDTVSAATWVANPREKQMRESFFNSWRRNMCFFLGLPPGPGLGSGGITLTRV